MTAPFPHAALAALAVTTALAGAGAVSPAPARAAQPPRVRTVCARQARVLSTPGGLVVGFLARGAPAIVLRRTVNRYWTEVRAVHSLVGWIHTRDLC